MMLDDATRAQVAAADPSGSTWLMANAGAGKTRVLTDRVAWLLLQGAKPEGILCLTYTKAAAAEMQNRLFKRLGGWVMLDDASLSEKLLTMGVGPAGLPAQSLARARTLFAQAIEAPGGLKIQTIHAYCAYILRRFPLEAGVSPAFVEIEERQQDLLSADVLDALADGPQAHLVADVARFLSGSDMAEFLRVVLNHRAALSQPRAWEDICAHLGMAADLTADEILRRTFLGDEGDLALHLQTVLKDGRSPQARAQSLFPRFPWDAPGLSDLAELEAAVLQSSTSQNPDQPKPALTTQKNVLEHMGNAIGPWTAFLERVAEARQMRCALLTAERTHALAQFAAAWLPEYAAEKAVRGWLDFDDLIAKAEALLTDPALSPWVLYRLDGGIDHLLVDEAQDTSPQQWNIIKALADEMAAGEGARGSQERSLFVVGDRKQSIYSFQGADPTKFEEMGDFFAERLAQASRPIKRHDLLWSFRSSPAILKIVDAVATGPQSAGLGQCLEHKAFHQSLPGRVDVWPVIEEPEKPTEMVPWYSAQDLPLPSDPKVEMARRVADWIEQLLANRPLIQTPEDSQPRALCAGDILILLRKRSGVLFHRLIKEIKGRGLPILGADKFSVTQHIAVQDLRALLQFLATNEDDLSLATVLRTPIFGWTEDDLFRLAHGRPSFLWTALRERSSEEAETLLELNSRSEFVRPFELLQLALVNFGMRRKLVARLGIDAEDAIDALLDQALSYERQAVPSLTGFLDWLDRGDLQIKRDPGGQDDLIRVMTVHGAKGLEAPLVILPDAGVHQARTDRVNLLSEENAPVLWLPASNDRPLSTHNALQARKDAEQAEADRLLYVAMTRAANWLVVGAAGKIETRKEPAEMASWYGAISKAVEDLGGQPLPVFGSSGLRFETGQWSTKTGAAPEPSNFEIDLPGWMTAQASPVPEPARVLRPSDLGGPKAVMGDPALDANHSSLQRGRQIHLLLEHLPTLPQNTWEEASFDLLDLDRSAHPDVQAARELLMEARSILDEGDLAFLFEPTTLAEVSLTAHSSKLGARLEGQIDRLSFAPDRVLAVDFKSNALVPEKVEDVPEGLLRQMGAYSEMLAQLYPDRPVQTALLWTRTAKLMMLPHDLVIDALQRTPTP